jgi:hypothetical protein
LKTNGNYKYSVNDKLELEAWNVGANETLEPPMLRQPGFPGGANFLSIEEAEKWADEYFTELQTEKLIEQPVEN